MKKRSVNTTKIARLLPVLSVLLLAVVGVSQLVLASGETISGGAAVTSEIKVAKPINDIVINGTDDSTVPVKLLVSNGTLAMSTTTGLTFTGSPTGSTLYFSGVRSAVNAALATLKYTRTTTGTDTLEISLVAPGEVFLPENGHLYEYVSSTLDWNGAKTAAESRSKYGATGYLATITSQAENDFVSARLSNAGWMGASDSVSEGAWKWVTGPEGTPPTQFWQGTGSGNTVGGNYANWNGGEPNDSDGNEDCGQFLAGSTGKWNDLPCSGSTLPGYVVEYGSPLNMPTVAAKNVSITTSDTVAPTVPGTPSTTTPTTTQKPVWSWAASTDGGTGLASPAYSVQWSQSSSFSSGVSSGTSNSTSFTQPSNLADGTWYFHVRASDVASNTSSYSSNGSVVIDTAAPTAPGLSATTVSTRFNTPTLSWSASSDSGVGLANPIYTVQRSQSATFASGITSSTTNSLFYTTPALADGTWYVRVGASDLLSHASAWSPTVTYIIDTAAPSTPGTPATATPTNNKKPTWTWTGSSDSGVGLASPAYMVQWSQSSSFSSGVSSDTSTSTSFTQPANLADGTWYFRVLASDSTGNGSSYSAAGSVVVDSTPASISNVLVTAADDTTEAISWSTDKLASSQIAYGPTVAYGDTTSVTNVSPRVTSHSVTLSGLVSCTLYHYQITSNDALGNQATSGDSSLITPGCAGAAVVTSHTDSVIPTSGGNVSLNTSSGTVQVVVPANFSPDDADFQIKQIDTPTALSVISQPTGQLAIGSAYDIKAMKDTVTPITSFTHAVSVTLPYTEADIEGIQENSLVIYRWDDGTGWQILDDCQVSVTAHTVTCNTPGFSTFVLFGTATASAGAATSSQASSTTTKSHGATARASSSVLPESTTPETSQAIAATGSTASVEATTTAKDPDSKTKTPYNYTWRIVAIILTASIFFIIAWRRRKHDDSAEPPN